jgi:rSAM/selenodomain-associated transferase 1
MKKKSNALILFARTPRIGKVKTRLNPKLPQETILKLYTRFLNDSIEKISRISESEHFIAGFPKEDLAYFDKVSQERNISIFPQLGNDLGEKMRNAFEDRFKEGYEKVVIIGSDSPSLPLENIQMAFRSEKDIVIGPSADSGYYLIGMNRKRIEVFEGVSWGSDMVLNETLKKIQFAGASLELLPVWYDVDEFQDLALLKTHVKCLFYSGQDFPKETLEFLEQIEL